MALPLQTWVEKVLYAVETHWLSGKEKFLGAAETWKDPSLLISLLKKCNYKLYGKIHLIYWMTHDVCNLM